MEAVTQQEAFHSLLRSNFKSFYMKCFQTLNGEDYHDAPYIDVLCDYAMQSANGDSKRLNICIPPRAGKSLIFSVALPAYLMGHNPKIKLITASYSQDLASKFARDQRTIMEQPWYQQVFPQTRLNPRKSNEEEFETTKGGYRMATSPGGRLTGRGADFLIFDDIMKPSDASSETYRQKTNNWFDNTAYSRLNNKQEGCIINVMQRLHEDDFVRHLMDKGEWDLLELPAIAEHSQEIALANGTKYKREVGNVLSPQREPRHTLERIRHDIGSMNFNAQYQQQPVPEDGNMVRWNWFKTYSAQAPLPKFEEIIISWDTASSNTTTSDYSACTVWGLKYDGFFNARKAHYYLLHVHKGRYLFPDLIEVAKNMHLEYEADRTIIEDCNSGTQLIQMLKKENIGIISPFKPQTDKVSRLYGHTALIEQGLIHIPDSAPWLDSFKTEVLSFPNSKHDDVVDSFSQFLNWCTGRKIPRVYSI